MSFLHRAEEIFEGLRKEQASKITVEKAKALKLKLEYDNLEKIYKQKVSFIAQ